MKKAYFLHGFLGGPEDFKPFSIEGYQVSSIDLRPLLFLDNPIENLAGLCGECDLILGYSFGGRLAGELKKKRPKLSKHWIFVSSRHSPYPEEEFKKRKQFQQKLKEVLSSGLSDFYEFWDKLDLFSGHSMQEYRSEHRVQHRAWTAEEISRYLDRFFFSEQFWPEPCSQTDYFYGMDDAKYTKEARLLSQIFTVHGVSGGHRFLFEDPKKFMVQVEKVLK